MIVASAKGINPICGECKEFKCMHKGDRLNLVMIKCACEMGAVPTAANISSPLPRVPSGRTPVSRLSDRRRYAPARLGDGIPLLFPSAAASRICRVSEIPGYARSPYGARALLSLPTTPALCVCCVEAAHGRTGPLLAAPPACRLTAFLLFPSAAASRIQKSSAPQAIAPHRGWGRVGDRWGWLGTAGVTGDRWGSLGADGDCQRLGPSLC